MNNLFIFFLCPPKRQRIRLIFYFSLLQQVLICTLLICTLTKSVMSAPSILNTNRLFSDINCIPFTTQNEFSKTDVDGLAPKSPPYQINKTHNMKNTSVLPIYNTARVNTDITDINFSNPTPKINPACRLLTVRQVLTFNLSCAPKIPTFCPNKAIGSIIDNKQE